MKLEVNEKKKFTLAQVKEIPNIQIKGQYLIVDRRNCGGKCSYK